MMIPILIIIISLILDGIFTNFLPYLPNDLSLFTPLLTLVTIFVVYPFYRKKEKQYYITIFMTGILYDLFYTNLLFFHAIIFLLIAWISKYIYKNFEVTFFSIIIYTIILITIYESTTATILFLFQVVPLTFSKVLYKITHSILLNIFYVEIIYFLGKIIPKKYKRISIN